MFESQFSVVAYEMATRAAAKSEKPEPGFTMFRDCGACGTKTHTKVCGPKVAASIGTFANLSGHCSRHPIWEKARPILLFYRFMGGL